MKKPALPDTSGKVPASLRVLFPTWAAVVFVVLAVVMRLSEPPLFMACLAAGAVGAFAGVCYLLQYLSRAESRQAALDERFLQTQKMAAVGELAAGIAHELNNPLAIILQETDWIREFLKTIPFRDAAEQEELLDSMAAIASQVDRSRGIIRRLLDFARTRKPVIQAMNLNKLVGDMAVLVELEAKKSGITIHRQFTRNLLPIFSDPPLLRQVILNLLTNAVGAIGKNGDITIATAPEGPRTVLITVTDTGCGIPPEHLGKIFDPFFTTKPPGRGTGLGLAVSHQIILSLGGTITVASTPGQGATFTIRLPRYPPGWEKEL